MTVTVVVNCQRPNGAHLSSPFIYLTQEIVRVSSNNHNICFRYCDYNRLLTHVESHIILMATIGRQEVPRRKPTCAQILDANLEELRQMQNLESLRPFLIEESCFQNGRDPRTDP